MELFKSSARSAPHPSPKAAPPRKPRVPGARTFSLGGHRSLTTLIVSLLLIVSVCVYFVNAVVLTEGSDPAYYTQAQQKAQLTHFNTSSLQQAQTFSANTNNTSLPAGRINPFVP